MTGVVGSILTVFFANKSVNPSISNGIFYGGSASLFGFQIIATLISIVWAVVFSFFIIITLKVFVPRWIAEPEVGLDIKDHGQSAYSFHDKSTSQIVSSNALEENDIEIEIMEKDEIEIKEIVVKEEKIEEDENKKDD